MEIAIKWSLGKLPLPEPPSSFVQRRVALAAHTPLPFTQEHALSLATLEWHHKDPFDRMLVAQASCEGLTLVTADAAMHPYGVSLMWVG